MMKNKFFLSLGVILFLGLSALRASAQSPSDEWQQAWPKTDFSKSLVPFDEIQSGGPEKDGIPSIDHPRFSLASETSYLSETEPVISLYYNKIARAYPLQILIWHEIVNDTLGDTPVAVTYCPLCNAAIVFDRRYKGQILEFGTTGKLRNSNLVMYDRSTGSWWQQFTGLAIIGTYAGKKLNKLPARLESFEKFKKRFPNGFVLNRPTKFSRAYGQTPYIRYDRSAKPFLYDGQLPTNIAPMARVIAIDDQAWSYNFIRLIKNYQTQDLKITWQKGRTSALDTKNIAQGQDIGNISVQRKMNDQWQDIPYDLTFAFVFYAFHPQGRLHR